MDWYDYGFRFYDPILGRFPCIDPIADEFAHVSPYNYAENNPSSGIDLWGLQFVPIQHIMTDDDAFKASNEANSKFAKYVGLGLFIGSGNVLGLSLGIPELTLNIVNDALPADDPRKGEYPNSVLGAIGQRMDKNKADENGEESNFCEAAGDFVQSIFTGGKGLLNKTVRGSDDILKINSAIDIVTEGVKFLQEIDNEVSEIDK